MRIKLIGILLLVSGIFVFTRGTGWNVAFMAMGAGLCFLGVLLVAPRTTARRQTRISYRRGGPFLPRRKRVRI